MSARRIVRIRPERPAQIEREMLDEIASHIALSTDTLVARGMSPDEADHCARARFGESTATAARLVASAQWRQRHVRTREWLDAARCELRWAVRRLARDARLTATITLVLGVALGAGAAVFSLAHRLFFSVPADIDAPSSVMRVEFRDSRHAGAAAQEATYAGYLAMTAVPSVARVAAYTDPQTKGYTTPRRAGVLRVAGASASFFRLLGTRPTEGRFPIDTEDAGARVVVLTSAFSAANHATVGSTVRIGDETFTVIGIAPPGFTGADLWRIEAWAPLRTALDIEFGDDYHDLAFLSVHLLVRLPATGGAAIQRAQRELTRRYASALSRDWPAASEVSLVALRPGASAGLAAVGAIAAVVAWLAAAMLVVAGTNAATLLSARALRGRHAVAVRLAMGTSRRRLVAHFAAEMSVMLVLVAAASCVVAFALQRAIYEYVLPSLAPQTIVDQPVQVAFLAAAAAIAIAAATLPSIILALSTNVTDVIRADGSMQRAARLTRRPMLVVAQVALSVTVALVAGLFLRSAIATGKTPIGFAPRGVIVATATLPDTAQGDRVLAWWSRVARDARRSPRLRSVSVTTAALYRTVWTGEMTVPGHDPAHLGRPSELLLRGVDESFAATLGLHVEQGRFISAADTTQSVTPIVLSARAAARGWGTTDPIGARVLIDSREAVVVGVVGDVRDRSIFRDNALEAYIPLTSWTHPVSARGVGGLCLLARADGQVASAMSELRAAIARAAPNEPMPVVQRMQSVIDVQRSPWLLAARVLVPLSALALVVALIGLYGLLDYFVASRRTEWTLRAALGASPGDILLAVVRWGAQWMLTGMAIGLGATAAFAPHLAPMLFNVGPRDPLTYAIICTATCTVGLVAVIIPARRATTDHVTPSSIAATPPWRR